MSDIFSEETYLYVGPQTTITLFVDIPWWEIYDTLLLDHDRPSELAKYFSMEKYT